jgi:hypothetical protein
LFLFQQRQNYATLTHHAASLVGIHSACGRAVARVWTVKRCGQTIAVSLALVTLATFSIGVGLTLTNIRVSRHIAASRISTAVTSVFQQATNTK